MDIKNVLTYLKEELKDIPAKPDNIHYTDFEGLYYILQSGLKGQSGGYTIKSPKTKDSDMELSTVRNSHKPTQEERKQLSSGAAGKVKINLFTNRILAGLRGARKDKIAELPQQRQINIKRDEENFKKRYGFDMPKFFDRNKNNFKNLFPRYLDEKNIQDWIIKHHPDKLDRAVINDIYFYNRELYHLQNELENREREERFILKKNIPVNPDFIEIEVEGPPLLNTNDDDFCQEVAKNYLKLLDKHKDVFIDNKGLRLFKNYLRKIDNDSNKSD